MTLINSIFDYLTILLIFINTLLYLKSYRYYKEAVALKYFSFYLLIILIITSWAFLLAFPKIPNLFLSHFYFVFQFLILSMFYRELFNKKQKKWVLIVIVVVLFLLAIQYYKTPSLFFKFNLFEIFITSLPLVVYAIIHLYNSLSAKGKYMYINSAVLIYITTSTLIFILGDYISSFTKSDNTISIWFVNKVLYVCYLLLILVQWKKSILPRKNK